MKHVFLIIALCFAIHFAGAQRTTFGLKGGLNIANLKVQNVNQDDLNSRISLHVGGLAHIHLSRYFALQPEFVFSGQGMKDDPLNIDWNLNYINVPLILQYMTGTGFRLETGPQIGFLVNAKIGGTDAKDRFKGVDFSWAFGASYLTTSGVGFGARYNLGISDINDVGSNNIMNRVFQVGIFYMIRNYK